MHMDIVQLDPCTSPLWRQLLEQSPSSLFHSPQWLQVISDTYGWRASAYILADDTGTPRSGIPFCRIADIMGERIVSLPFSDYCDPLANDANSWEFLADQLLRDQCPITVRCLHNGIPLADTRFPVAKQARWHGLDLRPELNDLWNNMHDSTHRAIRKSQREGVQIRFAETEQDLRAFFEMHLKIRKYKYGLLAQPYSFFQNIWRHFMETHHGFLLLAVLGDRIVAGDLFLEWKETLYYKFNASTPEALSVRPNDSLIWEAIQYAKNRGLKNLDFGLSDIDQDGLIRYKRKFGTEEKTISFLRYSPNAQLSPAQMEFRDLLTKLTNRFTDQTVPDPVTEKAGEDLYYLFT
jgi:CelD/BcsL family acetyltransferase involved in cellulose biosynthesis